MASLLFDLWQITLLLVAAFFGFGALSAALLPQFLAPGSTSKIGYPAGLIFLYSLAGAGLTALVGLLALAVKVVFSVKIPVDGAIMALMPNGAIVGLMFGCVHLIVKSVKNMIGLSEEAGFQLFGRSFIVIGVLFLLFSPVPLLSMDFGRAGEEFGLLDYTKGEPAGLFMSILAPAIGGGYLFFIIMAVGAAPLALIMYCSILFTRPLFSLTVLLSGGFLTFIFGTAFIFGVMYVGVELVLWGYMVEFWAEKGPDFLDTATRHFPDLVQYLETLFK